MRKVTMPTPATYEDRLALVQSEGITMDGQPAHIAGARLDWPVVVREDGLRVEFAWSTVLYVVKELGGKFRSAS